MPELLQRFTPMKVAQVKDRMKVRPDGVYVIPPNKDMSILHGALHLFEPTAPRGLRLPIDFFFRSLADDLSGIEHRRSPVGHGLRRDARGAGHQGKGRARARAGPRVGQIRQHAAQRHRRRSRRPGGPGRGTPREDRRLPQARPPHRPGRTAPGDQGPERPGEDSHPAADTHRPGLLPVQETDRVPPGRAPHGHPPDRQDRLLRPLPAGEPPGGGPALQGIADRGDQLLPRAGGLGSARGTRPSRRCSRLHPAGATLRAWSAGVRAARKPTPWPSSSRRPWTASSPRGDSRCRSSPPTWTGTRSTRRARGSGPPPSPRRSPPSACTASSPRRGAATGSARRSGNW